MHFIKNIKNTQLKKYNYLNHNGWYYYKSHYRFSYIVSKRSVKNWLMDFCS